MTTFGWKRKLGEQVSKSATSNFQEATGQRDSDSSDDGLSHWERVAKQRKIAFLEDAQSKSKRLKEEGTILAQAERYWEAIKKWDEALQLTPDNENILDMKAQALLILHEVFPAVQAAEAAVKLNPRWWTAYQTLGRVQLGLGEVKLAVVSFSKALHINPADNEIWAEDLGWALSLLKDKYRMSRENTEQDQDSSSDTLEESNSAKSLETQTTGDGTRSRENIESVSNMKDTKCALGLNSSDGTKGVEKLEHLEKDSNMQENNCASGSNSNTR